MSDQTYFDRRAENEARMAEAAAQPRVRVIHEQLRNACLRRAKAGRLTLVR